MIKIIVKIQETIDVNITVIFWIIKQLKTLISQKQRRRQKSFNRIIIQNISLNFIELSDVVYTSV